MLEHTFWDAGANVDDLADELVRWFRRRGFETQDFSEGRTAVVVQARKASWLRTVSGMNLALTVRLTPRRDDLRVEIGASEWTDKAIGGALAMLVAWPFAITTGIGLFQQSQLPQEVLDTIETYLDTRQRRTARGGTVTSRRGAEREDLSRPRRRDEWDADEAATRHQRREREDYWIEQELAELEAFEARLRAARGETEPSSPSVPQKPTKEAAEEWDREIEPDDDAQPRRPPQANDTCPECDAPLEPGDRFCMECGARLK